MPEFTLDHIDQISRDIGREEIVFSHLLNDLIDHVCCDVEDEMKNGLSFSDAYLKVKKKMGNRRLKEIQEETLYIVDTKYRNMKNTMKISGIAGTITFGLAALFKIQHWPGAAIMLTTGALILAFIFLPSALGVLWKETHNGKRLFLFISGFVTGFLFIAGTLFKVQHWPLAGWVLSLSMFFCIFLLIPALLFNRISGRENRKKRPVYILGSAGIIFYISGMLFKIQHWPLASVLLITGLIILFAIAFPLYTWINWREESHISPVFLFMVIGSLMIVMPSALVNLNLQNNYNDGYYSQQKQQQVIYETRFNLNQSFLTRYHDSVNYEKMIELHNRTVDMLESIGNIQKMMIESASGNSAANRESVQQTNMGITIRYNLISNAFDVNPVSSYLLPSCSSRQELNRKLDDYADYLAKTNPDVYTENMRSLLDPSKILPGHLPEGIRLSLMSGLHSLEVMKNNLLTVESFELSNIAQK